MNYEERLEMYSKCNKEELTEIIKHRIKYHTSLELAKILALDDRVFTPNKCSESRLNRTNLVNYSLLKYLNV